MKVCPSCRKLNADDAAVCSGCSADLSEVVPSQGGRAVTMFGAAPESVVLDPLERAVETVARQYGAAIRADEETAAGDDGSEEDFLQAIASSSPAAPSKPWER